MFRNVLRLFKKDKGGEKAKSDFLRLKGEIKKPAVVSSDMKGPPVAIPMPEAPKTEMSKPQEDIKPLAQLPPDIDPGQVVIVKREARKPEGERFRYVDKPLKPLNNEAIKAEVIKYDDKKGEVIKYKATPAVAKQPPESKEPAGAQVFKYIPKRVEIKN
jgi:hypothetical protein